MCWLPVLSVSAGCFDFSKRKSRLSLINIILMAGFLYNKNQRDFTQD